jgi:hypothetical protein
VVHGRDAELSGLAATPPTPVFWRPWLIRWVVQRFFSHLHRFRKLRLRTDWTMLAHDALLKLACSLICLRI